MRLIILLFIVIAASITWYVRRVLARKRLRQIDEGQRCIACGATDVTVTGDEIRCLRCGVTASLSALTNTSVTEEEIRNLTSLD